LNAHIARKHPISQLTDSPAALDSFIAPNANEIFATHCGRQQHDEQR